MKMLKVLGSIVVICAGLQARAATGSSSPTGLDGVSLNPQLGLSVFSLTDTPSSVSNTSGFTLGVLSPFGTGKVRFEPGLLFMQQGASDSVATATLNYLLIPLAAKFIATQTNGWDLHLRAGVAPAILLSAKGKYENSTRDITSAVESFDLQGLVGLGGTIATPYNFGFTWDISYMRGFLNVLKGGKAVHNTGFVFAVGAIF